jgi:hypothetical protein
MLTTYPVRVPYPEAGLWKIRDVRPPMGLPCRFMRVVRRVGAAAVAVAFAALLGGCSPQVQPPPPKPSPSSSPVFASDEEALAAATKAYAAYLKVSDQILMDSGADPDRIEEVSTSTWANAQMKGFRSATERKWRSTGGTTFDSVSLQRYDSRSTDGIGIIRVYLCLDVSTVDVLDSNGNSVVSDSRPDRSALEVWFDQGQSDKHRLLVAGEEPWTGTSQC